VPFAGPSSRVSLARILGLGARRVEKFTVPASIARPPQSSTDDRYTTLRSGKDLERHRRSEGTRFWQSLAAANDVVRRMFRPFSAAVATTPEDHRSPRLDPAVGATAAAAIAQIAANKGKHFIVAAHSLRPARTTAHLASALDNGYAHLIEARGVDIARVVYQSQSAAIDRIEAIQANERIACDFQRVDGYLVLATPDTGLRARWRTRGLQQSRGTRERHARTDRFARKESGPIAALSESSALSSPEISRRAGAGDRPTRRPPVGRHRRRECNGGEAWS
jgi:hypothetical protein